LITTAAVLLILLVVSSVVVRRPFAERTLIVGTTPLAEKVVGEISLRRGSYAIVGVVDDVNGDLGPTMGSLIVGSLSQLGKIVDDVNPDRIVVALADRRGRLPVDALIDARVRGIAVEDGVRFYERLTGKIAIEALTPSDLFSSSDFRKSHLDLAFGHALSLAVALMALVVLAPLFALIAIAIKLDSPGPVLFVHDRVGLRCRRFRLLKFRTMRPVEYATSEWARDNGDRVTRVGKWLRRFRFDELPQLINMLRGEMNLIGPRPHPVSNFELFNRKIPYYSLRAVVRPGLTGWAQVRQGYANSLEEETEKMRFDLYYIKHMSAWIDLRILMHTVWTIVSGRGSSHVTSHRAPATVVLQARHTRPLYFESIRAFASKFRYPPAPALAAIPVSHRTRQLLRPAPQEKIELTD
jgi:exopolysaccharide biosynthesis polyprenyl glycosylphosphotransferase